MTESNGTLVPALQYGVAGAVTGTALGYYSNGSLAGAVGLGVAMGLAIALAIATARHFGIGEN